MKSTFHTMSNCSLDSGVITNPSSLGCNTSIDTGVIWISTHIHSKRNDPNQFTRVNIFHWATWIGFYQQNFVLIYLYYLNPPKILQIIKKFGKKIKILHCKNLFQAQQHKPFGHWFLHRIWRCFRIFLG